MRGTGFYLPWSLRGCTTTAAGSYITQACVMKMTESAHFSIGACIPHQPDCCVTQPNVSMWGPVKMLFSSVLAWIQTYCPLLHSPDMPCYSLDAFAYKHKAFISVLYFRQQELLWLTIVTVWGTPWARKMILLWLLMAIHWSMPFHLKSGRAFWTWHSPVKQSFVAGKKFWNLF